MNLNSKTILRTILVWCGMFTGATISFSFNISAKTRVIKTYSQLFVWLNNLQITVICSHMNIGETINLTSKLKYWVKKISHTIHKLTGILIDYWCRSHQPHQFQTLSEDWIGNSERSEQVVPLSFRLPELGFLSQPLWLLFLVRVLCNCKETKPDKKSTFFSISFTGWWWKINKRMNEKESDLLKSEGANQRSKQY